MTWPVLLAVACAGILLFGLALGLFRAASQTPRRGEMARYIRPAERRMTLFHPTRRSSTSHTVTLIKPTPKGPREAA